MPNNTTTVSCKVLKADEVFRKCVNELDAQSCVDKLGIEAVFSYCEKKTLQEPNLCIDQYLNTSERQLELRRCAPDSDKYYFTLNDEALTSCDPKNPQYLTGGVHSTVESYECSIKTVKGEPENTHKGNDFILSDGPNKLNGFCLKWGNPSSGTYCYVKNSGGTEIVVQLGDLFDAASEGKGKVNARLFARSVPVSLNTFKMSDLEKMSSIVDIIIAKGLDSLGIGKITPEELKEAATCNEGEICGNGVNQAGALLDATRVKEYISDKLKQAAKVSAAGGVSFIK